jgi:DNA-binding NtrC family response regulator
MPERARLLIIDDDENIRKTMSVLLEGEGYIVDTAENGKQAIEKSQRNFYNLALIDIRLPDMYGTQLLTEMKNTTPKMIKIMVTGYAALDNAMESMNRGADGYVTKPVDPEKLLTMINDHLKEQEEIREYGEEKIADHIRTRFREVKSTKEARDASQK